MKSGSVLWTATLIMMLWLAVVADAYFLPDKVSIFATVHSFTVIVVNFIISYYF